MTLKEEILAKVPAALINSRDEAAIAASFNVGRTRLNKTEVGSGTILSNLGKDVGNALIDVIYTNADFRHMKPLLEQGRLDLSVPLLRETLDALAGVIPGFDQAAADKLKDLAVVPNPISAYDVAHALES